MFGFTRTTEHSTRSGDVEVCTTTMWENSGHVFIQEDWHDMFVKPTTWELSPERAKVLLRAYQLVADLLRNQPHLSVEAAIERYDMDWDTARVIRWCFN